MHFIELELLHNGFQCYKVGGCVRDRLLNKKSSDIDFVTNATPDQICEVFKSHKLDYVGKSFGVVLVDGIEVATFRKDRYFGLSDKNVEITYAKTLKEDLSRRDLTINAIAENSYGSIIDLFDGVKDLNNKVIRFVGNPYDRIYEDPCRILRACRFLALINGSFAYSTKFQLSELSYLILKVPPERIHKEIMKTMQTCRKASLFFRALHEIGGLHLVLPSINECYNIAQNRFHLEDLFTHIMDAGDNISCKYPLVKLASYMHDIGKVATKEFSEKKNDFTFLKHHVVGAKLAEKELKRLKFSNEEIEKVSVLIRFHMNTFASPKACRKVMRHLEEHNVTYKDAIRIRIADRAGRISPTKSKFKIKEIRNMVESFEYVINFRQPTKFDDLDINGNDIMEFFKIPPGREVGILKELALEFVLENPENNQKDLILDYLNSYRQSCKF